jgi:cytoskeletal protein CcmA (bactofilin family)
MDSETLISDKVTGLLQKGTSFEGKLSFEGSVIIGGTFKGEFFSRDTLIIDETADVEANIEASEVIVAGKVRGNIYATKTVRMKAPAKFKGTVTTVTLSIDDGVIFEGASYMPKNDN